MKSRLTKQERNLMEVVMQVLARETDRDTLMKLFGSMTCLEIVKVGNKLHYQEYCEKNGIKFEEMTDDDYVDAYLKGF